MSNEENINLEEREAELWKEVNQSEGADRARALTALSRILWDKNNYKESLAFCETARDLYLEAGRENYLFELTDVNFGVMNNSDMLGRNREAAEAAGLIIELYKETDHPMLGELLRDQGRYWFACGEYELSLASHLEAVEIPNPEETDHSRGIDSLNIAMARKRLGDYEKAIAGVKEALEIFKGEKSSKWVSKCHAELAEIYFKLNDPLEIHKWARKALDFAELAGDMRWEYILNYYIGVAYRIAGDLDSAEKNLAKAKFLVNQRDEEDWESVVKIEKEIAAIEKLRGRDEEAAEILRRIATIEETLEG